MEIIKFYAIAVTVIAIILFIIVIIQKNKMISTKSINILRDIVEKTSSRESISEAAFKIIQTLIYNYQIDYCTIFLKTNRGLKVAATNVNNEKYIKVLEEYADALLKDISDKNNKGSITKNDYVLTYPTAKQRNINYRFFMPLRKDGETTGALLVENTGKHRSYKKDLEKEFFKVIKDNIITIMQNLKFHEERAAAVMIDGLTGIYNRKYIDTRIPELIEAHKKLNEKFSIAMLDIDFFKKFNDIFGHDFGDEVLKLVSSFIKNSIRDDDFIARYGGEEFTIFFSRISNEEIEPRLNEIREQISQLVLSHETKGKTSVTISLGLSEYPKHGQSANALIKAADTALYKSKKSGRNCVTLYREDIE